MTRPSPTRGVASLVAVLALLALSCLTLLSVDSRWEMRNAEAVGLLEQQQQQPQQQEDQQRRHPMLALERSAMPQGWSEKGFMKLRQDGYSGFKDVGRGWTKAIDASGKVMMRPYTSVLTVCPAHNTTCLHLHLPNHPKRSLNLWGRGFVVSLTDSLSRRSTTSTRSRACHSGIHHRL